MIRIESGSRVGTCRVVLADTGEVSY